MLYALYLQVEKTEYEFAQKVSLLLESHTMKLRTVLTVGVFAVAVCAAALFMGCKIGSPDSVSRHVGINVAGLYRANGGRIISQNTGAAITQFNLIQDGDRLQAIDNNGMIFKGSISSATDSGQTGHSANFSLKGHTTAGAEGIISGAITVSGNQATMRGTWAEPTLYGNVLGYADVVPTPDPKPEPTNGPSTNANARITL